MTVGAEYAAWLDANLKAHFVLMYQLGKEGKLKMDNVVETSREFISGAKRSSEEGKLNFIGALSPFALETYLDYLRRCNNQAHRTEENWKRGIPLESFMRSQARHFLTQWKFHAEGREKVSNPAMIDAICGVLFNAFGYLHELTKPDAHEPGSVLSEFLDKNSPIT